MIRHLRALRRVAGALSIGLILLGALHFPYDTDASLTEVEKESARNYYSDIYKPSAAPSTSTAYETEYMRVAAIVDEATHIETEIAAFVARYNLKDQKILEIGSGRGRLQDIVPDYTGLDISANAARFYHKPFVLGSATAMPFNDNSFDAAWTIAVFEHIPNPEQALSETRRVLKHGAVLFFQPAWNARPWAAEGYEVRPYSDFGIGGKLIKASIPLRSSVLFRAATMLPVRLARSAAASIGGGPTTLRYRRLEPNYETYWVADSDAVNAIDSHEAMLWFTSRGDECLSCPGSSIMLGLGPLVIRVHKESR